MKRTSFFFERQDYSGGIDHPHYRYKGYLREVDQKAPSSLQYPVSLHFDRDEIIFTFQERTGRTHRLFSLYMAEGELNQQMLIKKIENYWKASDWKPPFRHDEKEEEFVVDNSLLSIGFFVCHSGLAVLGRGQERKIGEWRPFKTGASGRRSRIGVSNGGKTATFPYKVDGPAPYGRRDDAIKWNIKGDGRIVTDHIDFRQLLLDFLFELDNSRTFEDKNFFRLQPIIQNNILLDALSRKCTYLAELRDLQDYERRKRAEKLPKKFRDAEYQWLNVCFQDLYQDLFISADSVFATVEEEVENVFFRSRIGRYPKARIRRFSREEEDVRLRNQAATFFLRRYSIVNAFSVLMPRFFMAVGILMLLGMTWGDFCWAIIFKDQPQPLAGYFSAGLPFVGIVAVIAYYWRARINLFKLLLPRMFLGIVIGWAAFWETEEAWTTALSNGQGKISLISGVLFLILCLYVFTNIRNKLIRVSDWTVLKRTVGLVLFAMLISFTLGFYVIQFKSVPVLEASGFLTNSNLDLEDTLQPNREGWKKYYHYLQREGRNEQCLIEGEEIFSKWKDPKEEKIEILEKNKNTNTIFGMDYYKSVPTFLGGNLYYIWSLHLSQFMIAIMVGIMLQLLWEDKSITEPL